MTQHKKTPHWDKAGDWYQDCVGEKGHYYHEAILLKGVLRLLQLQPKQSLLDLGCGQGVLQRALPPQIEYTGVDQSKTLLTHAQKMASARFITADVCEPLPLPKESFDAACFLLSLQNMDKPEQAIAVASTHLKKEGKLLFILNHPCFRIPRQSHWGIDEAKNTQYRRLDVYMTPQKIPIQTHPGKGEKSHTTYSFHYPLSCYINWCNQNKLSIIQMEEWCSDKTSEGGRAKMENRARKEFPMFLAILAQKTV